MDQKLSSKIPCQNYYFLPDEKKSHPFSHLLKQQILQLKKAEETLILLCVGTDKITGDCLGPLVGTKLIERNYSYPLYGTLENPVHGMNLSSVLPELQYLYPSPFFLVVDAALGPAQKIGYVSLSCSPLTPGKGIRRNLPSIGNISITGIIGESGRNSEWELPYTRLYLVNTLADYICDGILGSFTLPKNCHNK